MASHSFKGGVHPLKHFSYGKHLTNHIPSREIEASDIVVIPLSRMTGAPLDRIVSKGDFCKVGQKIGESQSFFSAPIHASVSGKVIAVEPRPHPSGTDSLAVVIENDHRYELDDSIQPTGGIDALSPEEIIELIKNKGIVGMGGATFPTHVKLTPPKGKTIDLLIANGAECEPYLTADHRLMLETPDRIIYGIRAVLKALGLKNAIIGIEENKPNAVRSMKQATAGCPEIQVHPLKVKYPQGSEKQLIYALTRRRVPNGGLPADAGVAVLNVGTLAAIADAVKDSLPLIQRIVTVTGGGVKNPANVKVRIGTSFADCIKACGGMTEGAAKIVSGGPMMGIALASLQAPVIAGTSGILVLSEQEAMIPEPSQCIRCGRCIDTCPMNLMPLMMANAAEGDDMEGAERFGAMDCIECGSCVYICPANRHILQNIRIAKNAIRAKRAKK